jgi:hypothetical protein
MSKKSILKSAFLIAIMFFITNVSFAQKTNQKAIIKTSLHCDHCKQCETCGQLFDEKMFKINGLKMYELDEKAMTFTVYYNAKKTNLDEIRKAISMLGYDADDIKANAEAYEKLDDCCKK